MEHTVTTKKWYVVTGTAGATVTSPDGSKTFCTVPEGGQGVFYATTPKVVTSDDSVEVAETTFNSAPVKLRLLGLLGGGVSTLPSGYLTAEFLESTGTQWINTKILPTGNSKITLDVMAIAWNHTNLCFGSYDSASKNGICFSLNFNGGYGTAGMYTYGTQRKYFTSNYHTLNTRYNYEFDGNNVYRNGVKSKFIDGYIFQKEVFESASSILLFGARDANGSVERRGSKRIWKFAIEDNGASLLSYIPALDPTGTPCMYDTVTRKPFPNSGTGQFIVGMTLEQARKLSKLPKTGGSLTVSLPSNYAEDEGVVNALATAQENGWVITIQTYEAETGAASTFALRRIWVRKCEDEQGSYVDTDGFRWQVEWCVDVVGADPQELGYEPFRSVDVAVNYWNLQPWVDPEAEEELLTNTEE